MVGGGVYSTVIITLNVLVEVFAATPKVVVVFGVLKTIMASNRATKSGFAAEAQRKVRCY